MQLFRGDTANDLWLQSYDVLSRLARHSQPQPSRAGATIEVLLGALELRDPRQRWIVAREPAINPAFAIAEVIWMLAGSNEAAVINYWNRQLPKYAGATEAYGGAYGYRLRRHFGLDQLRRAVDVLHSKPDSRQVVLQFWSSSSDLPHPNGEPVAADVPCNLASLLKVRQGRLYWTQIARSNDIIRGLPYNIVQFTTIQEIVAGWLGLRLGSYHHVSDSLHMYTGDIADFTADASRCPQPNADTLAVPIAQGEVLIATLFERMRRLSDPALTRGECEALLATPGCPRGYLSLLTILICEAARRRRWFDLMEACEVHCTNSQLRQLWQLWRRQRSKRVYAGV